MSGQQSWLPPFMLFLLLCVIPLSADSNNTGRFAEHKEQQQNDADRFEQLKLMSKSRPREANSEIDQWLTTVPKHDLELRERLITTKAFNLMVLSENDASVQLLEAWLHEVQQQHPARTTRALEILGYISMRRGDHIKASNLLAQAVQLSTEYNQPERQITSRIYTAIQAVHTGQNQTALELFQAARALNEQYKFDYLRVNIQNNISNLRIEMGQYQQALTDLMAALDDPAYEEADLIYVKMSLARCYLALKQHDTAQPYAEAALLGYQQREDPYYQSVVLLMLAEIAQHQQDVQLAQRHLDQALTLATAQQLNRQLSDAYLLKSQLLQQQQQDAQALQAMQQHLHYYKKYHNEEAQQQLLQLQNQIENLRKQQKIKTLEQELTVRNLKSSHQRRTVWLTGSAALAIILLLLFLVRLQQKKRQQSELYSKQLAASYQQLQLTQRHLIASEKMAATAGMVAGLAHELNTPLGILTTALSLLQEKTAEFQQKLATGLTKQDLQLYLADSSEVQRLSAQNVERCARLVQHFKQLAVQRSDNYSKFNLQQLITDVMALLASRFDRQRLSIDYQQTELMLYADAQSFQLLLVELIDNAILHAFPEGKTGQIRLWIKCLPEHWELHYEDNGMGFSASSPDKVFEPFYTTSRHSGHTGLGLNLVYNLVTVALEGEIEALAVSSGFALVCRLPNQLLATTDLKRGPNQT
ncbi:MAG TPA: hypothetical protein DF774_14150 [Rheinheimera sp.]|uniref:ATP-binding protein n=1 Tax=Rheinheimera sp. TaxID=1869214 RepID=UPI000EDF3A07|nr:ATP-binding protein [Rheinheimera sp.]HCU66894.1 hypothetical protein [Rheinheimera sp.]